MKYLSLGLLSIMLWFTPYAWATSGKITTNGTTCQTVTSCLVVPLSQDKGGATLTLSGTWTGTIQFEATGDGGNTWTAVSVTPLASTTTVTSTTANGVWQVNMAGFTGIRMRSSASMTGAAIATVTPSFAPFASGRGGGAVVFAGAPSGVCGANQSAVNSATGDYYSCNSGVWLLVGPGAAGSAAFSTLTAGTNAGQALVVGNASTLSVTGTGIIDANKINGVALSGLSTGILKNTTTTGVPSIAVAGDFPTLNQSTSGTAALATSLAATPTKCSAGNYPLGVDAGGNAQDCTAASGSGTVTSSGSPSSGNIPKFTTSTNIAPAAYTDIVTLWASGSCSGFLKNDGTCASAGGTGTVTVVGAGSLTSTALVTGGGTTTLQTPSATATMDSSGNMSTPGKLTTGAGGSVAGLIGVGQGTLPSLLANGFSLFAPTGISTGYGWSAPTAENASAGLAHLGAASSHVSAMTVSAVVDADMSGTVGLAHGGVAQDLSATGGSSCNSSGLQLVKQNSSHTVSVACLGAVDVPAALTSTTSVNKVTLTAPATGSTLTIADGKTFTASNSITVAGTDSTTMTFPSVSATIPRTVASGTSAMGTSAVSSGACATVVTTSATGTLTTDAIIATPNADPTGVTGYAVSATGSLYIVAYPTADNVNFKVCNNTAGSLTPSALTMNWRVIR